MADSAKGSAAFKLVASLLLTFGTGALGALASQNAGEVYAMLQKPAFAPPAWVFGPVWGALYLLSGLAFWRVWRRDGEKAKGALSAFLLQLAFQVLWSVLFFALGLHFAAFVCLLLLLLYLLLAAVRFFRADRAAGFLLLPLLLWVTYAGVLQVFLLFAGN